MGTHVNSTAGQAHPYWYEWFVGLIEVIKLLNPDEGIRKVAFQVASIQGWDDVVVTHSSGKKLFQVKHTREKNNLTFGSLVESDRKQDSIPYAFEKAGTSLLRSLFEGAKNSGIIDSQIELVLYTNREDGSRWTKRANGDRRPPLLEFWRWLKSELETKDLTEIKVPSVDDEKFNYSSAWKEWIACFSGSEKEGTLFLRQLTIRTKEDDLDGLETRIRESLAHAFGIAVPQAGKLFDALCRELRFWTTGHSGVTVELLCDALTIEPSAKEIAQAPPPPTPFFPSRLPIAKQLESELLNETEPPIIFLTGEPGSGKTSAVSWLANRRTDDAFQGVVGIRFFCFEPIRPDQPFISPDASRVKPDELWFSLLTQLRRGLMGRLNELQVPLRNEFLTWAEAREHVLRLADALGHQLGRKFVIAIDGIDHAARASQVMPEQIANFFASLPSPDEVQRKCIRFLFAGQPPEYYSKEYPTWLKLKSDSVRRIDLPKLDQTDIYSLLKVSATTINSKEFPTIVRLIDGLSNGNTLSVVFAIAEAELCNTPEELETRLTKRSLGDGLSTYYDSIWNYALRNAPQLSCTLSGVISLARTPLSAYHLSRMLSSWKMSVPWWNQVLNDLGPLLTRQGDQFQIRFNDVRVFLASVFSSFDTDARRISASELVDHFQSKDADRLASHLQLFPLLKASCRQVEAATLFTTDWVLEGVVLGLDREILQSEGELAVSELSRSRNWSNVVSVSCALDTLDRASDYVEHHLSLAPLKKELPPFLPSEVSVRPFNQWTKNDFHCLVWDANELCEHNEHDRARGLLSRWLDGISIDQLVRTVPDFAADFRHIPRNKKETRLDQVSSSDFEWLGKLSARLDWRFNARLRKKQASIVTDACFHFEKGFVDERTKVSSDESIERRFAIHSPRFFSNYELAVRNLAKGNCWQLVGEVLEGMQDQRDSFSKEFIREASWYALKSGLPEASNWIISSDELKQNLPQIPKHYLGDDLNLGQFVNMAMSIGWTSASLDSGDIADLVFEAFEPLDAQSVVNAMKLLFRTAAVIGRYERYLGRADTESAIGAFQPNYIKQLLSALWGDVISKAGYRFRGHLEASLLADQLSQICCSLGTDFDQAVLHSAIPFAEEFVRGPRLTAIWNVLSRHGRVDLLRAWVTYYISRESIVWSWSTDSTRQVVDEFLPLARSIGLNELADYAEKRAKTLVIGYVGHKEYSFDRVSEWYHSAAKNDPKIWKDQGWRLWELCRICDEKDGDNRLESKILTGISASAIRDGMTAAWWRLTSTTVPKKCERDWHWRLRELFVEGYLEAFAQGHEVGDDEKLEIWSIALSLSYWCDKGDTSSLLTLRAELLRQASPGRILEFDKAMRSVCSIVQGNEDNEDSKPRSNPSTAGAGLITESLDEDAWWREIDEFLQQKENDEYRYLGFASQLMTIAYRRARLHGNDVLLDGLGIQLDMHMRWAFGGENIELISLPALPDIEVVSTDDVFVELVKVLLDTYSVEVTVAAMEGIHNYVAQNPAIIPRLFEELSRDWPQHWLLSAAESWAVLYPDEIASSYARLNEIMSRSGLLCRLQAWVVLVRNAQTLGIDRPKFPVPKEPKLSASEVDRIGMSLMEIPPTILGSARFANKFSSIRMMINYCELFGFNFERLEGLIAKELANTVDDGNPNLRERGPHRHADYTYVPAEAEIAFGNAVSAVMSSDWCTDEELEAMCQAVLPNEDTWIQRLRPASIRTFDEWPAESDYDRIEISNSARQQRMLDAARQASIEPGWTVFAARVRDFTEKEDFDVHFWLEELAESFLIQAPKVPWCPTGRSFVWWIGTPTESSVSHFVSGLFAGGHQRLSHSHFEIRPPLEWREVFGWSPNPFNPLEWSHDGHAVAKYQKVHGVLRDAPHGPKYRQPMIDRWIITDYALDEVKARYPNLLERNTFEVHSFKD